jgi:ATP-dependent phosphoenolpyruvate carboxykinase
MLEQIKEILTTTYTLEYTYWMVPLFILFLLALHKICWYFEKRNIKVVDESNIKSAEDLRKKIAECEERVKEVKKMKWNSEFQREMYIKPFRNETKKLELEVEVLNKYVEKYSN